jgi:hypothetical protein
MEPEISLLCSQEPSTDLYHEPDQSNPYYSILSLKTQINTIHPLTLILFFLVFSFLVVPSLLTCMNSPCPRLSWMPCPTYLPWPDSSNGTWRRSNLWVPNGNYVLRGCCVQLAILTSSPQLCQIRYIFNWRNRKSSRLKSQMSRFGGNAGKLFSVKNSPVKKEVSDSVLSSCYSQFCCNQSFGLSLTFSSNLHKASQ